MGTPIFPDLGKHCSVDICKQIDFLPFTCDRCLQVFCLDHRNYMKHECPKGNKGDVTVVICPLCATKVRLNPDQDANISWEEHVNSVCDPSNVAKKNKKQCPVTRCREVLTFSNTIKCRDCSISHCLKHRFGPDHTCSGPKIPESSVLSINTNEATSAPASSSSSSSSAPASSSSSTSAPASSSSSSAPALSSSSSSRRPSLLAIRAGASSSSSSAPTSSSLSSSAPASSLSSSAPASSSSSTALASSSSSRRPSLLAIRAGASSSSSRWSPMAPASSSSSSRRSRTPTSQPSIGYIVSLIASVVDSRSREQNGEAGQDAGAMQVEDEDEGDIDWEVE